MTILANSGDNFNRGTFPNRTLGKVAECRWGKRFFQKPHKQSLWRGFIAQKKLLLFLFQTWGSSIIGVKKKYKKLLWSRPFEQKTNIYSQGFMCPILGVSVLGEQHSHNINCSLVLFLFCLFTCWTNADYSVKKVPYLFARICLSIDKSELRSSLGQGGS